MKPSKDGWPEFTQQSPVKVKVLKVGSGELTNLPLQEHIAKQKLTTIISTGMSEITEIKKTVDLVKRFKIKLIKKWHFL